MGRYFITAAGTGYGKTYLTAHLIREARKAGHQVNAAKPVITGFDPADMTTSDTGILLNSLGLPLTPEYIERVSPWRFREPLAPSMAARLEERAIDFTALVAHSRKILAGPENIVLIEGIGGVMVPLDDTHTVLDWMAAVDVPALLIVGTYLGSISHTLTALEVLRQRGVTIRAVIVNESENATVTLGATIDELKRWTNVEIIPLQRGADGSSAFNTLLA